MSTITNSIFINDEDGELQVELETTRDSSLNRLILRDGYTGAEINILGTVEALVKVRDCLLLHTPEFPKPNQEAHDRTDHSPGAPDATQDRPDGRGASERGGGSVPPLVW